MQGSQCFPLTGLTVVVAKMLSQLARIAALPRYTSINIPIFSLYINHSATMIYGLENGLEKIIKMNRSEN